MDVKRQKKVGYSATMSLGQKKKSHFDEIIGNTCC